jgi:hypothetical protein
VAAEAVKVIWYRSGASGVTGGRCLEGGGTIGLGTIGSGTIGCGSIGCGSGSGDGAPGTGLGPGSLRTDGGVSGIGE